jgi:hypothetical protein
MQSKYRGTTWKSIGDAMNIDFSPLTHGPSSFTSGFQLYEDLKEWAEAYEKRVMVPDKYNHKLAEETTAILLYDVPSFLKPTGKQIVSALMDDRLRKAMMCVSYNIQFIPSSDFINTHPDILHPHQSTKP